MPAAWITWSISGRNLNNDRSRPNKSKTINQRRRVSIMILRIYSLVEWEAGHVRGGRRRRRGLVWLMAAPQWHLEWTRVFELKDSEFGVVNSHRRRRKTNNDRAWRAESYTSTRRDFQSYEGRLFRNWHFALCDFVICPGKQKIFLAMFTLMKNSSNVIEQCLRPNHSKRRILERDGERGFRGRNKKRERTGEGKDSQ